MKQQANEKMQQQTTTIASAAAVAAGSSSSSSSSSSTGSYAIVPTVFSIVGKDIWTSPISDKQVSFRTYGALAQLPREPTNSVAQRIANAFLEKDPHNHNSIYFSSFQFQSDLLELSAQVAKVFETEARSLRLASPVYVFGDLHGNVSDLRFFAEKIWKLGISLTAGRFLFLGDYVDRGLFSLECVAYLFALKLLHPHKVFLLRGNHETRAVNGLEEFYGAGCFLSQCKNRFGSEEGWVVWNQINTAFDRLPLAAVIDDDIFCVHGGIPRK